MKHHVNKIASACFYHIRRLRQIRHHVSREVLKQLLASLVLSCLDYCNAILAGLRASTLMPLQRAQNDAARLALGLDRRSSITTALRDLHWLPVKHRIIFKVANLMHQALHRRCPAYLADLVAFSSTDSHRQLRSTTTRAIGATTVGTGGDWSPQLLGWGDQQRVGPPQLFGRSFQKARNFTASIVTSQ